MKRLAEGGVRTLFDPFASILDDPKLKRLKIDIRDSIGVGLDLRVVSIRQNTSHPLMLDVVLDNLFSYCSVETLKVARLVNHRWNLVSAIHMQRRSISHFTMPTEFQCTGWSSSDDRKNKHEQFLYYAKCYLANKLPCRDNGDAFLFRNYSFTNFQYFGSYQHDKILKFLQKCIPSQVRSLRFRDDAALSISDEFLEINQITRKNDRHFYYPVWDTVFSGLVNLQSLELIDMPRSEIEKCLTALEQLLEKGTKLQIRKLVVSPKEQLEFHLDQFAYLSYVDLLKNVVSLLPVQELHLRSKCSAEEIRSIIESRKNHLKTLVLHRYVPVETTLQEFQNAEGNLFKEGSFPILERLELPTVYTQDLRSVFESCPNLKHLKLTFQPTEMCQLGNNQQGNPIIHRTRGFQTGFIRDQILDRRPRTYANNCKLESLQWALDDSLVTTKNLTDSHRRWHRLNFIVTHFLTSTFPRVKSYTGVILSEHELRAIFRNLLELEELKISRNSIYSVKDIDLVGTQKFQTPDCNQRTPSDSTCLRQLYDETKTRLWGIRPLRNLKRLYLENDNSEMTYESFDYGFLKLPFLQILHIHRAEKLSKDDTAIIALLDSSSLAEVQIHEN
ncbi:unnamed protein product [Allacma fusca]|uniref:F-box domain-containing protein n=1 Tax=Allacma fusca TaxID=39272 RepID=A0A8J2KGN5_9HEXA|nr:unnamed protein product [Allacma fusca]